MSSNVEMMRNALIEKGVSPSAVAQMNEQQLINECKARNIKLQEGLNNNANWGRGDEVEFATNTEKADPYTEAYNKKVEKKDEKLYIAYKYLKKGDLGLSLQYLSDAVALGYDISNMPKDMKDAFTQKSSLMKTLGFATLVGLAASTMKSCEYPESLDSPSTTSAQGALKIKKPSVDKLAHASINDVQEVFNVLAEKYKSDISADEEKKIVLYKEIQSLKIKLDNYIGIDKIEDLQNVIVEMKEKTDAIKMCDNLILNRKKHLEILENGGKALLEDLNKTATLQEREAVLNKEEHKSVLALFVV